MTKELRRRLLAIAEGDTLSIQEWWMVDLVCRQGLGQGGPHHRTGRPRLSPGAFG